MRLHFLILLGVFAATESVLASVLAIDYGTDWIKASLIKPGVPFDVLLNRDSKRKIQASVGWKGRDRLFGSDAFNMGTRFPKDSFSNLKYLQGQTFDTNAATFFTSISTADIVETARKTIGLRKSDDTEWTVEELMAMEFAYVKDLAESTVKDKVMDVVVAVPPFFSQFERQAVLDAIEISGLKPIALLNDGTAVAVNYALTRAFQIPETHVIYDAGAGAIRATVVTFSSVAPSDGPSKINPKSKGNTTVIESKAIGYVRGIGGNEFDRRLREILIEDFNNRHHKDVRKDARGMTKLWKEAGRVKSVLSANALVTTTVESVAFDIDYRSKISRDIFEESLKDLEPLFTKPITDALVKAGLTLNDITSVIFMGGTSRIPIVQQAVKALVGEAKIAQNVNTDEAAVLGAAFYGASISSQFKTKNIKVVDVTPYDIQVSYSAEAKTPGSHSRTISTVLFPAGSKLGAKKTLTLKRKDDIELVLSYKYPVKGVFPAEISQAQITGVSEAFGNLTERGAASSVIKVTIALTESGFAVVQDAVAFGEIKDESIAGKLKGFFGGAASSKDASTESSEESLTPPAPSPTAEKEKNGKEKEKDQSTIALNVDVAPLSIHPLTYKEKQASRERLVAIDQAEKVKQRREDARNVLEAYLYRLRDLLDSDSNSTFMTYSKELERSELFRRLEETFHWLAESGDTAEIIDIWEKTDALEAIERPIQRRHQETETLIPAIADFEKALIAGHTFLESARQNYTLELAAEAPHKYTLEEIEDVETRLKDGTTWLKESTAKQKALAINDDPVLFTDEVRAKGVALQNHVVKLMKRKTPKPKKTSTSEIPSAATMGSNAENATATETETIPTATETEQPTRKHNEL